MQRANTCYQDACAAPARFSRLDHIHGRLSTAGLTIGLTIGPTARAATPRACTCADSGSGGLRPVVNHSGEPMQPREQPHLYSEGKPPYVGDFHRPVDEAALLAYALQVFREPPPSGVSVLAESRRWTWWWAGRPLQVCN